MNNDYNTTVSRIIKIERYLTSRVIKEGSNGYAPMIGDEDQPMRDELLKLRKLINLEPKQQKQK